MVLSEKQKAAAKATDKNVLVLAPPGAGKTATIVEHAAYLIEKCKTSPYELCLLTFTRLAAKEMRNRLEKRIGKQAYNIQTGTFHSIGLNLIQRFGELIGLHPSKITVYGEFESSYLLKEIAIELGIFKKSWKPKKKDILKTFSNYYEKGIGPEKDDPAYAIFKTFGARLRENNSLSYDSILTGFKLLLPHIHKYLQFKHIICDEAHDNSKMQWDILKMLQELLGASLYVIADTDQAIYGWRNADVDYLVRNQEEFTTYKLETNYRSDGHIVEAANNLISHNKNRIEKTMKPFKDAQTPITIKNNLTSAGIVGMYMSLEEKDPGVKRAILGRNHFLLKKMSQIMEEAKIPHTYIGKETALTNSEEFRRFHAFLKLIVNPFDNFAFLLIREIAGVSIPFYADIRLRAAREGKSHFQVWNETHTAGPFENAQKLEHALVETDIMFRKINSEFTFDIINFAYEWLKENPKGSIEDYLNWLAVYDIQDEIKEAGKGVQLMTMHAAKGLEFPTVIIAGMNEGILPSSRATDQEEMESERRLFFVAITRAEDQLIITTRPEESEFHGKVRNEPISRFLGEMKK